VLIIDKKSMHLNNQNNQRRFLLYHQNKYDWVNKLFTPTKSDGTHAMKTAVKTHSIEMF